MTLPWARLATSPPGACGLSLRGPRSSFNLVSLKSRKPSPGICDSHSYFRANVSNDRRLPRMLFSLPVVLILYTI